MRLNPRPLRQLALLAVCSGFVAIGVLARHDRPALAWMVSLFFGLGALVAAINLVPGSSFLELKPTGFDIRSMYRTWHVRWEDVEEFFVAFVAGQSMVCWNYAPGFDRQKLGRRLATSISGVEAGLPDTYGKSAQELADLLNEWRARKLVSERQPETT